MPHPRTTCLVADDLASLGLPFTGGRYKAEPARWDSGWVFYAGDVDWTKLKYTTHSLSHAAQLLPPEVWRFVALPAGWAFQTDPNGHEDVWQEPGLLE